MLTLPEAEIAEATATLPGWRRQGSALEKAVTFSSFPEAIAFVVRLAFAAESADHHPDICVRYREVRLRYWTHSAGGITIKDIEGARLVEAMLGSGPATA
jgi:4a-hydroxytetrahydrobiopterin dehydratase